jgi:hypothetical protein
MDTLFRRPDRIEEPLYVLTTVFNSARWRTRWKLYEDFARMVARIPRARLYTVEVAFGQRAFALRPEVAQSREGDLLLQLRTCCELWHKERALNLLAQRLPHHAKYLATIDADMDFVRDDWADETIHQLQHYHVVQMYSEWMSLSADDESLGVGHSFMDMWLRGGLTKEWADYYDYAYYGKHFPGAPGGAVAYRREAWDALGGLIDWTILGSGDSYMANALVGRVQQVLSKRFHVRYRELILEWQARAERSIKRNVGVVKGLMLHHWHGSHSTRGYEKRNDILIMHQYNPDLDIKPDVQGLYQLTGRSIPLRDAVRKYFHQRNEDALS